MNRNSERRKREVFFYAESEAELYDVTVDWVVPQYHLLHAAILELLTETMPSRGTDGAAVVDIGSGTGVATLAVLGRFPKLSVIAVDFCAPMQARLRQNFAAGFPGTRFRARCTPITADFLGPRCRPARLRKRATGSGRSRIYGVVSAFTFHHFDRMEKEAAYRRAFDLLEPSGVLVNGDLFAHPSEEMSEIAQEHSLTWIRANLTSGGVGAEARGLPRRKLRDLGLRWERHYRECNLLEPLEGEAALGGQIALLQQIGFREVAVPYRFWQSGILWARK